MREILFRAKHIHAAEKNKHLDGVWVYGYLADKNYINTQDEDEYGGKFTSEVLIDPETVCQYTGLNDKNEKRIFEGDIIRYLDEVVGKTKIAEVKYNETHAAFCRLIKSKRGFGYLFIDECAANKSEVIGNIFDNPELCER